MKIRHLLAIAIAAVFSVQAWSQGSYSPEQLDQLLAPIALYPDPLIALILPASTIPTDLTLAAGYLAAYGDPSGIDSQPWDPSVKGLARYPDVLKWMNDNLDWTHVLGAAFTQQPSDVMKSVQQLRTKARAAGNLIDTSQQQVSVEGDNIRIVPAQEDVIYVPQYDYDTVYEPQAAVGIAGVTFGVGYPVGPWLGYQLNWEAYGVWIGPWSRGWGYRREWQHPGGGDNSWHAWHPDGRHSREVVRDYYRPQSRAPGPLVIGGNREQGHRPAEAPRGGVYRTPAQPDYRGRPVAAPPATTAAPPSHLLNGYNRGTQTRDYSNRGQASRTGVARPVPAPRAAPPARPAAAPARQSAPARQAPGGSTNNREHR